MQSNRSKVLILLTLTIASLTAFAETREIYLTRHAEKQADGTADPSLTQKGKVRANTIAQLLKSKNITAIYSTKYKRTMQTAEASAKLFGYEIKTYDPRKLDIFAQQIKKLSGNILVVGHSNTTPDLVVYLGGDDKGKIEESEYDRLYQLTISNDKVVTNLIKLQLPEVK
jgi:broad specificity phosphatase PhoE